MDSHMDIEKTDASESARAILPRENMLHNEKEEQTHIQNAELPPASSTTDTHEIMQEAPPLTSALEALLGGLDTPPAEEIPTANALVNETPHNSASSDDPMVQDAPITNGLDLSTVTTTVVDIAIDQDISSPKDTDLGSTMTAGRDVAMAEDAPTVSQIPGLSSSANPNPEAIQSNGETAPEEDQSVSTIGITLQAPAGEAEEEHPEWEVDSSPIESSSDDSSDSDSSDESEEGDNAYKLLSPEEQARILMEGDGGSDDEGDNKAKGSGTQVRTKNEIPEVVIPKPDVTITEAMPIRELGVVEAIVENTLLIKANTSGEYRVLESGAVLCLADRSVIGVVSETIGRVQQPFYSVLFTNAAEIKEAGLEIGTKVFYSEQHSTYVFTQALKAFKGSDASNLHDEEVGDEEMEFSDDEAEAEHKRKVKQKRLERRGGMQQNASTRGGQQNGGPSRQGHPSQQRHALYDASKGLSYDDNDDGPYKPLARPAGYADTVGRSEAPHEGAYQANNDRPQSRDSFRGRGRGERGDRGRGRGDRGRGRGRGGFQDRPSPNSSNGYSLPPQGRGSFPPPPPPPQFTGNFQQPGFQPYQQPGFTPPTMPPNLPPNFFPPQQNSPQQPQMPNWQQFLQQPFPNAWPNMPPPPPLSGLPGGAYINPAFFNSQQQSGQQNQWNQQNQQQPKK